MRLPVDFYRRADVVEISRDLLGKVVCARIDDRLTEAVITETEAYAGESDKASHAWGGRRTRRTEPMYAAGGRAYVYLCYGIHHLFNVVTNVEGTPHAVLVRAGRPLTGIDVMLARRGKARRDKTLMGGPGTFSQALGIRTCMTGTDLRGEQIWIEDRGVSMPAGSIRSGPRVGVDYAAEDAALPYRFIADAIDLPRLSEIRGQETDGRSGPAAV
jgi:DNA-3-methyladenine glycosylase